VQTHRLQRQRTVNDLKGLIHPRGMPIAVAQRICTPNCKASNIIGESKLLRAAFETSVLAVAQHRWNEMAEATCSRELCLVGMTAAEIECMNTSWRLTRRICGLNGQASKQGTSDRLDTLLVYGTDSVDALSKCEDYEVGCCRKSKLGIPVAKYSMASGQ